MEISSLSCQPILSVYLIDEILDNRLLAMVTSSELIKIKDKLRSVKSVAVLTGAGISAESGVPVFRGEEGLWNNYRAEELATPGAFRNDPELVWSWYNMRREKIASVEPNDAHKALAIIETRVDAFTLITQNVDGLHQRAGSSKLLELHGNIWKVRCTDCRRVTSNVDVPIKIPPYCDDCGNMLRPHIVWFGETLDPKIFSDADTAVHKCDILIVVGTSGIVQPAASMARTAKSAGAYVVEINYDATPISDIADLSLRGKAVEILTSII